MSEDIHEGAVYVTKLCGPASLGEDRAQWQFSRPFGHDQVTLNRAEVTALANDLLDSTDGVKFEVMP